MIARLSCILALLAGCQTNASSSSPPPPSARVESASPPPAGPRTHTIVAADHRNLVRLSVGDALDLPADPTFEWRAELDDASMFRPEGTARFRAIKKGGTSMAVAGEPLCRRNDGGCGVSSLRWAMMVIVE